MNQTTIILYVLKYLYFSLIFFQAQKEKKEKDKIKKAAARDRKAIRQFVKVSFILLIEFYNDLYDSPCWGVRWAARRVRKTTELVRLVGICSTAKATGPPVLFCFLKLNG